MNEIEILLVVIGTVVFLNLIGLITLWSMFKGLRNELDIRGQQLFDVRSDYVSTERYHRLREEIKALEDHFGIEIVHRPATKEIRVIE